MSDTAKKKDTASGLKSTQPKRQTTVRLEPWAWTDMDAFINNVPYEDRPTKDQFIQDAIIEKIRRGRPQTPEPSKTLEGDTGVSADESLWIQKLTAASSDAERTEKLIAEALEVIQSVRREIEAVTHTIDAGTHHRKGGKRDHEGGRRSLRSR